MKIQKKHIMVAALVLALGAAVYINWQFSGTSSVKPTSKELGAVTYVNKNTTATADETAAASKTMSPADKIAQARTQRAQAQDKALDEAKNIITLSDSSDDAKKEAVEQASDIEKRIVAQSNIESILSMKGFSECLCYVTDSGCTVTVLSNDMQQDSPLVIKDAVLSQLDIEFNDIVILDI